MATQVKKVKKFFGGLGPGLVAGASDNDPTSVATLSVIGSITVYGLLRLVLLILPMLLAIQVISSPVGAVTGRSLQAVILSRYGRVWSIISLLFVAAVDVVTIAADLEGGRGGPLATIRGPLAHLRSSVGRLLGHHPAGRTLSPHPAIPKAGAP